MPKIHGWHHVSLSVSDLAASEKWFTEVLGLEVLDRIPHHDGWEAVICGHAEARLALEAQYHDDNAGERFDPNRTGLDHIGFAAKGYAELEEWQAHFERLGVDHTPITTRNYGHVLTFRHPDGIQFEMFVLSDEKLAEMGITAW